jgi:ATP-dependent DNA helicase RecG
MGIVRSEELGSGVLNVSKYLPFYSKGAKPRFIEGDPFRTIIPLPSENKEEEEGDNSKNTETQSSVKILQLLAEERTLAAHEIAETLRLTTRAVEKQISNLQKNGRLRRIGPDKGGHWEVLAPARIPSS